MVDVKCDLLIYFVCRNFSLGGQLYALNLPELYCGASQNLESFMLLQEEKNVDRVRS